MVGMATKKNPWGARLKRLRLARGLTQEEASASLKIPLNTLRNWEQGRATPTPYFRRMVEKALGELGG